LLPAALITITLFLGIDANSAEWHGTVVDAKAFDLSSLVEASAGTNAAAQAQAKPRLLRAASEGEPDPSASPMAAVASAFRRMTGAFANGSSIAPRDSSKVEDRQTPEQEMHALGSMLVAAHEASSSARSPKLNSTEHLSSLVQQALTPAPPATPAPPVDSMCPTSTWFIQNKDEKFYCSTIGLYHITTFDKTSWHPFNAPGTWWLIHTANGHLQIQAEYRTAWDGVLTAPHAIAIGGTLLQGKTLTVRPGCIWSWEAKACDNGNGNNGKAIVTLSGTQVVPQVGQTKIHTWSHWTNIGEAWRDIPRELKIEYKSKRRLLITLPNDATMQIRIHDCSIEQSNFGGSKCQYLSYHLETKPLVKDDGCWVQQCGHCGNFNGNQFDERMFDGNGLNQEDAGIGGSGNSMLYTDAAKPLCQAKVSPEESMFTSEFHPQDGTVESLVCEGQNKMAADVVCRDAFQKRKPISPAERDSFDFFMSSCVMDACAGAVATEDLIQEVDLEVDLSQDTDASGAGEVFGAIQDQTVAHSAVWPGIKWAAPEFLLETASLMENPLVETASLMENPVENDATQLIEIGQQGNFDHNIDQILQDDEKYWMVDGKNAITIQLSLKYATYVTGIRVKQSDDYTRCAFKDYRIEYAVDENEEFWRVAKAGTGSNAGLNQGCCGFQEIAFSAEHSRKWKLVILNTWGSCVALQYVEFHAMGSADAPSSHHLVDNPFLELPGWGKCANSARSQESNLVIESGEQCRTKCANDPGCPGYTSTSQSGDCIWYTDLGLLNAEDYNPRIRADYFDMRFATPASENTEARVEWSTAKCYRKLTPCPLNTQGHSVEQGCSCMPGFQGSVRRKGSRPWFTNTCLKAPCPASSELLGGSTGSCQCLPGYKGTILATMSYPYYSGHCLGLPSGEWQRSTTTTTLPGARYWGMAAATYSEDSVYQPKVFELYLSLAGGGNNLVEGKDLVTLYPDAYKGKIIPPRSRVGGMHFLSVNSSEAGHSYSWTASWQTFRTPIFYVDLGSHLDVRSARHSCTGWRRCPNAAYLVSSDDLVTWTTRLVQLDPKEALMTEPARTKARYWGVATGYTSRSGLYEPTYLDLFESRDGIGDNLATNKEVHGVFPSSIEGQTYQMFSSTVGAEADLRGSKAITTLRHRDEEDQSDNWYLSWVKHKLPNFYVDLGERYQILSARHGVTTDEHAPAITYIVSSDDLIEWRAQFVTEEALQETLIEQRVAKCTTMTCPPHFRPRDRLWELTCMGPRCIIGIDRDECCEPFVREEERVKIETGGGDRDLHPNG